MKKLILFQPLFLLLALGVLWGSGYVIARFAVTHGIHPLGYAFWQSLGPAILLCLFAIKHKPLQVIRRPNSWRFYFVCGLIGIAIPNSNMYFVAGHIPAGMLAIIVNTVPILIFPLALLFRQETFSWPRLFAVIIGVLGIMLLVLPHELLPNSSYGWWPLLALISPLMFALCAIYISNQRIQQPDALVSAAGMMLASTILLTPLVISTHSFYSLWPPLMPAGWLVIVEILLSSLGYVIFFRLINLAGPVYYSMVGGVVGITGLFWGWLIFNEYPTLIMLLATVLIVTAITWLTVIRSE
ncbi:MAG: DMT family transporter [Gammaproteobacteria bacterium]